MDMLKLDNWASQTLKINLTLVSLSHFMYKCGLCFVKVM